MSKNLLSLTICLCSLSFFGQSNYPITDPSNTEGWTLNEEISDEFNGVALDKSKWWIIGENGNYRNKWKGRAPGQYAGHNVEVKDGKLILYSRWEPDFNFANEQLNGAGYWYGGSESGSDKSLPITQASILSEKYFKYGYMEVRCKSADAPVTNAFWTTGYHSEIDITENFGRRPFGDESTRLKNLEKKTRTNLISWDPQVRATGNLSYQTHQDLSFRTAADFHIYGFEWDKNYMKIFVDGVLKETITRSFMENTKGIAWSWDQPQEIWFDNEIFPWYAIPNEADLINDRATFEIDYMRIWQKELLSGSRLDPLGFEGPFVYGGRSQNGFGNANFRLEDNKPYSGDFSLEYKLTSAMPNNHTFNSPTGALDLPEGANELNMKMWISSATNMSKLRVILTRNNRERVEIDLTGLERDKWIDFSQEFNLPSALNTDIFNGDRLKIQFLKTANANANNALIYIDDIKFKRNNTLSLNKKKELLKFNIYPNPAKNSITINVKEKSQIKIYNSIGNLVKRVDNSEASQFVSIAELLSGIYYVSVTNKNKVGVQKLVVK